MGRTLRGVSGEDPYSVDVLYGSIGEAVADEMFGLKAGDGGHYVDASGVLRATKSIEPTQDFDPGSAAYSFGELLKKNLLDPGSAPGRWWPDVTGTTSAVQVRRGMIRQADPYAIYSAKDHGTTALRISDPANASLVTYAFTTSPTIVRGICRMGGYLTDVLYVPE